MAHGEPSLMTRRTSLELVDLLTLHSTEVASDIVEPLARFMTVARRLCGGDTDKVLLMLVMALRSNRHPDFKATPPDQLRVDALGRLPTFSTNVRSLAESTGIPRETVRRKVDELVRMGWVIRQGRSLAYSMTAYQALAPAREAIIRLAVASYEVVSDLAPPQD
jgi:hypothetical protein